MPFLRMIVVLAPLALVSGVASTASAQIMGKNDTRIRLGLEAGAGGAWGTPRGPSIGLFGQLGIQFNQRFALFYQPSVFVHAIAPSDQANAYVASGHLGMMDLTFGELQLGVGGGVDYGRFASCDSAGCTSGRYDLHPALGARAAFVVGFPLLRARWGIPIGAQLHTTFLDRQDRLTAVLLTIGVQRY